MFKKILIANRGEIAMRLIRTCKEMGIQTVAVYSKADEESLHVRFADEAVCIGPADSSESYLKTSNIIAAAEITNADAIHPGYGFLSENSKFSKICDEHKIKFIGASPEMIDKMGDKSSAKETMKKAGIPTIPGSEGIVDNLEDAQKIAQKIGYPIMLKASAGGVEKGMRIVLKAKDLLKAWDQARQESKSSFDNDDMYIEKLIENPRHIEIQILGDSKGGACHLSERDCSIQRRHQKLIEETPSPFMTEKLRNAMGDAAVKAVKAVKYEGVGTLDVTNENKDLISQKFILYDNYPNPFNPSTNISYSISNREYISINIFDVNGGKVIKLFNDYKSAGTYSIDWNGENERGVQVSAGVYLYSIDAGEFRQTKKMILLK